MKRINSIVCVGYHHITVPCNDGTLGVYDTIDKCWLQVIHLQHKGGYTLGKERELDVTQVIPWASDNVQVNGSSILCVPNVQLFLACCDFQNCLDETGLRFVKTSVNTRLPSQEEFSWIKSPFFIKTANIIIILLEQLKRKIQLAIVDTSNYGLIQYKDDLAFKDDKLAKEIEVHYYNQNQAGLNRASLRITVDYLESLVKVAQEQGLTDFAYTLGGIGKRVYKKSYDTKEIEEHDDELVTSLERQAYIGARMEAFGCGHYKGKVYHVDFTSHYPSIAKSSMLPISLERTLVKPRLEEIEDACFQGFTIASVRVKTQGNTIPKRKDSGICYPIGQYNTILIGAELIECLRRSEIQQVYMAAIYKASTPLSEYCNAMLNYRKMARNEGSAIEEVIYKLLANSLIGKFGQYGTAWTKLPNEIVDFPYGFYFKHDRQTGHSVEVRVLNWQAEKRVDGIELKGCFPALPAAVCSYGRKIVNDFCSLAGWENIILICADSIVMTQAGWDNVGRYVTEQVKEAGKPHLTGISNGITVVSSCLYHSEVKTALSGLINDEYPVPKDFLESVSSADMEKSDALVQRSLARRRVLSRSFDGILQEYNKREWTRYPTPYLDEKAIDFQTQLLG